MKKKLSICMIVKNEEKNLGRCLDSLQAIMASVSSELIIVDTGSEDQTVSIANQYTEKVYFHPWNNNFSEMRNISIQYAQGEWILIIDADEVLTKSQGIMQFLNKTHPKQVVGATVLVKNLTRLDTDKHYVMLNSVRLFRNDGKFHYRGSVHNEPVINGEVAVTDSEITHYGYISTDSELMERKFQRTRSLLKAELEKNPEDIYYRFQLSVTYQMHNDDQDSLVEARKAYEVLRTGHHDPRRYLYVFFQLTRCLIKCGIYDEAEKIALEGIKVEKEYIDLYFHLAQAQAAQQKYHAAIESYDTYMSLVNNFDNLEIKYHPSINHYTLASVDEAFHNLMVIYYQLEDYEKAFYYVQQLWSYTSTDPSILKRSIPVFVHLALLFGELEILGNFYSDVRNAASQLEIEDNIEKYKNRYPGSDLSPVYRILGRYDTTFGILNRIRDTYSSGCTEEGYACTIRLLDICDLNEMPDYYGDILFWLIKVKDPVEDVLLHLTEPHIVRYLNYLDTMYNPTLATEIAQLLSTLNSTGFAGLKTGKTLGKYLLFSAMSNPTLYREYFFAYLDYGIAYMGQLYNPQIFAGELVHELKNVEEAFLLYAALAVENRQDQKKSVQYLTKAAHTYPDMAQGIRLLLEEIQAESTVDREMAELKAGLIQNVSNLIIEGRYEEAIQIVIECEKILGKDSDLLQLKAQILINQRAAMPN